MAREVMNMLPLCCSATVELMSNMNVISHVRKSDIYAANEGCHTVLQRVAAQPPWQSIAVLVLWHPSFAS